MSTNITNCNLYGVKWDEPSLEVLQNTSKALLNLTELFKSQNIRIDSLLTIGADIPDRTLSLGSDAEESVEKPKRKYKPRKKKRVTGAERARRNIEMRGLYTNGTPISRIAKKYKLSHSATWAIVKGKV